MSPSAEVILKAEKLCNLVLDGLQAGDAVIIFPSDLVVDGVEINDTGN
jgi:hypothetical protein